MAILGFFPAGCLARQLYCLADVSGRVAGQLRFLVLQTEQLILLTTSVHQIQSRGAGKMAS